MSKRVCKEDQIRLITECRQNGLSDYQWCEQNGIHPDNFYKLRASTLDMQGIHRYVTVKAVKYKTEFAKNY